MRSITPRPILLALSVLLVIGAIAVIEIRLAAQAGADRQPKGGQRKQEVARGGTDVSHEKEQQTAPGSSDDSGGSGTPKRNAGEKPEQTVSDAERIANKENEYERANEIAGSTGLVNTDGVSIKDAAGEKVVLVEFWTYSCFNCQNAQPHINALYDKYKDDGLLVVGVHTPEFAFEHVLGNVRDAVRRFNLRYPVALDNDYATWNAYANQYWPADYLIDRRGHVRHAHFGEGEYAQTEALIRRLLAERPQVKLPAAAPMADRTPHELVTPESYLGYQRLDRYAGLPVHEDKTAQYAFPRLLSQNELAYAGGWTVGPQRIVAGSDARLRLHFHAQHVYLVLGGQGRVEKLVDGRPAGTIAVDRDQLYTVLSFPKLVDATLELRFSPGLSAYAFTFG